ncbi:adenine deaminase C-terminal domain-containing protein [Fredinandcohnia sp. QZ13]|uniref:adenine deaminase C-terminal domain-containing protein n=1 Tax=Fredinandcohnia sp. QZ13 TaxID=3073144 RepID=UPI0028535E4F|nr:adenine deaminase C-terminal domain-containing protein [Fredinandcohnia sp. QZ13]MDR4888563.1 adenine deaminase C-terminal domain-containing protein [Fredinandcohnia sp. QZ13]
MRLRAKRSDLVEVAKGNIPADLYIKGGTVINVYSGEFLKLNVAVYKDSIAYVGESEAMVGEHTKVIHAEGKYVSPGFIEAHSHPWVVYNPISITSKVLPLGTTTSVNDNLFFYLHMGAKGFKDMVLDLKSLPGNFLWLVRLVSQADYPGERDWYNHQDIQELLAMEEIVGSAEVTRWPLLYNGDPFLLDTMDYVKEIGKVSDGHTSGCSYEKLNAIVASGVTACHEAITAKEALDRLRLGMWTTLRNSSLRPDLEEVIKMITEGNVNTSRIVMTTDGPHPGFIEREGFVDGLVRKAVELGVPVMDAIQMVTVNAATYLRLEDYIGGIGPGRKADILLLPDLVDFRPERVIASGEVVAEDGQLLASMPEIDWRKYVVREAFEFPKSVLENPELYLYPHPDDNKPLPVSYFKSNVITARKDTMIPSVNGFADLSNHEGLMYSALIDRRGNWVSKAVLERFAVTLDGMASTYNTTTELLTVGRNPQAMAIAATRVHEIGGGIVIVDGDEIILEIRLPLTGMMTTNPSFEKAVEYHDKLLKTLQDRGFPFHDILYTLLFLTCDFLPGLRLVPYGLYEVKRDEILLKAEALGSGVTK